MHLLRKRRFLPLFVTQFLGAFNDNLFKTAMVILVTYYVYSDPTKEAVFNAISGAVFILPFFLFSALAGQLAELAHKVLPKDFRNINTREARIIMLEGAPSVLPPFKPKLQKYTQETLEKMGVEIKLNHLAIDMDHESITVKGPDGIETIRARTRIWAAGVQAELHVWPGAFHGSASMLPQATLSRRAVAALRDWTGRLLGSAA